MTNHVSGPRAAVVLLEGRNLRFLAREVTPVGSLVRLEQSLCIIKYGNQENNANNSYPADDTLYTHGYQHRKRSFRIPV